ncbi:hypothetical protein JAAARDRAFT_29482 [Jaapia argillacea MUCL 33604]|uniref:Cobalamin-independent methionine synthase MetE C-terminal/archaeal domain-containing protein n=1 Tax=Jaapia argillacea MUCL 33604 TaxID=933084 RepID=A0A067Q949_9AGAM|nr:hypothetical protein JAAARDRAFT_29482 [Jaapia argillacea MUCL 33604]
MSAPRLNPPFRAEHIGSLLRPTELYQKRALFEEKKCTPQELEAVEDEAIKRVVKMQQELGFKGITDGELRRGMFFEGVFETMEGMTFVPNRPLSEFKEYVPFISMMKAFGMTEFPSIFCTGKIKRTVSWYAKQFEYLKTLVPPEEVKNIKVTICPPTWFHQRHGSDLTYDLSIYKNDDEYFSDLAKAYREEIAHLYSLGCRNIQFDDATFCFLCDDRMIKGMKESSVDHTSLLETYIKAMNWCVQGREADLCVGIHMCRGNFKGGVHYSEGGYAPVAQKLFQDLDVNCFYLEYDNERSGDFQPLKYLPLNKVAVLGLVTTKTPQLESVEELKARIYEAADIISEGVPPRSKQDALNQLCLSPQCGFASVWEGNPLTEEDERKKLGLVAEVAKQVWG